MNKLLTVLMIGLMLAGTACEKKEERILPKVGSAEQVDASQVAASEQARIEREAFISQAQAQIDELGKKLADVRQKAVTATGKAKEKLNQQVLVLEKEQRNVEENLANLKSALGETWKDFKSGVTSAIEQFKQAVQKEN